MGRISPGDALSATVHLTNLYNKRDRVQLAYDGKKFEVLLINGRTHRSGNTGYIAVLAEEVLNEGGLSYRQYNPE
jgi:hypothetical protein